MNTFRLRATALISCLLCGATANAVPVIYDFTGTGYIYEWTGVGYTLVLQQPSVNFTGWISFDVLAPAPSGPDSSITNEIASDGDGWVQSAFFVDWGTDNFSPAPVPGLIFSQSSAYIENLTLNDRVINDVYYFGAVDNTTYSARASLDRFTTIDSWLSDVTFNPAAGLAPGGVNANAHNVMTFENSYTVSTGTGQNTFGYFGVVDLINTMTLRPTSVSEPGTLALLGFGLAGLLLVRRRRAA